MLKQNEPSAIKYTKKDGTITERVIVPTFVPNDTIKAIDVTELSTDEAADMVEALREYSEYYENATKTLFKFEDWITHVGRKTGTPKWRSFIKQNIVELEETK